MILLIISIQIWKVHLLWKTYNCLCYYMPMMQWFFTKSSNSLQAMLNDIETYCGTYGLKINTKQTKVVIFKKGQHTLYNMWFISWNYQARRCDIFQIFRGKLIQKRELIQNAETTYVHYLICSLYLNKYSRQLQKNANYRQPTLDTRTNAL